MAPADFNSQENMGDPIRNSQSTFSIPVVMKFSSFEETFSIHIQYTQV